MTPEQKQKAIKVIQQDATLIGSYVNGSDSCVIGGLLLAVGFSREKLERVNRVGIGGPCSSYDYEFLSASRNFPQPTVNSSSQDIILNEMQATLQTEYGIGIDLALDLQRINDIYSDRETRRSALIEILGGLL